MTRQEKIREGISQRLHMGQLSIGLDVIRDKDAPTSYKADLVEAGIQKMLDEILSYLHSQGYVIKVEKALPAAPIPCPELIPNDIYFYRGWERCKSDMADYAAVAPLIEK